MADRFKQLLKGNKDWVENVKQKNPELFSNMAKGQAPPFLWIGCADSRVPAEDITNSLPGSIFVQRNIANMVVPTDYNLLSVVHYAIKALQVRHIIICGHYGCGGIQAAMSNESYGLLDNWLMHIKDVYRLHEAELNAIRDESARSKRLVEINVQEQVNNLAKMAFIQKVWQEDEFPYIHGWVFNIESGALINLEVTIHSASHLDTIYRYYNK
ncbi:MAG: carbonic anhydrase [Caldithrix sp.]|nr:carbonic anhydrase [Caldithrix sp.]